MLGGFAGSLINAVIAREQINLCKVRLTFQHRIILYVLKTRLRNWHLLGLAPFVLACKQLPKKTIFTDKKSII